MVRDEMEKVPKCIPDSFVKLYDELKDEKDSDDNQPEIKNPEP